GKVTLEDLQRLLGKCGSKERIAQIWAQSGLDKKSQTEEIKFEDFLLFMRSDGEAQDKEYQGDSIMPKVRTVQFKGGANLEMMTKTEGTRKLKSSSCLVSGMSGNTSSTSGNKKGLKSLSRMRRLFGGKTLKKIERTG